MFLRILGGLALALMMSMGRAAVADTGTEAARVVVDKLNDALIDVMKNAKQLGYQGRYKRLDPVVREVFQFEAVAQIALGSHWKTLSDEQKTEFVKRLTELSIATYAAQFNSYGGEQFQYDSDQAAKPDRVVVRYKMVAPKETPVKFDYMVNLFEGRWEIINIVVDGISDLALKKAQYTSVIDREGFDALMSKLTQKITDYANSDNNSKS
ncbi:MAG: HpnM family protein [Methylococcus sp.]|nr:HpnM family protein [Methylococcus sp.]